MKRLIHRIASVVGPVLTLGGALTDVLPSSTAKVVSVIVGTAATLLANLQKAFGHQTSEDPTNPGSRR